MLARVVDADLGGGIKSYSPKVLGGVITALFTVRSTTGVGRDSPAWGRVSVRPRLTDGLCCASSANYQESETATKDTVSTPVPSTDSNLGGRVAR